MAKHKGSKRHAPHASNREAAIRSYNDGVKCLENGDVSRAITGFRKALSQFPDFAEAHNNLGNALKEQGKWKAAEKSYRQALKLLPGNPLILSNIANALYHQNALEEALPILKQLVTQDPNYAFGQHNLGNVLMGLNRPQEAVEHYKKAYQLLPEVREISAALIEAMCGLGMQEEAKTLFRQQLNANPKSLSNNLNLVSLLHLMGENEKALPFLNQAHKLGPDNIDTQVLSAKVLLNRNTLQANKHIDNALLHDPENPDYLILKAKILSWMSAHQEAEEIANHALSRDPDNAAYHEELGNILKTKGDTKRAAIAYAKAIALAPQRISTYGNLAVMRDQQLKPNVISKMESLVAKDDINEMAKISLHFGLGSAYDRLGNYPQAFDHFSVANRLKAGQHAYTFENQQTTVNDIQSFFSRLQTPAATDNQEDAGFIPVFIVGLPRSGKTLVERLLALDPLVTADGETNDLNAVVKQAQLAHGLGTFPNGLEATFDKFASEVRSQYIHRQQQRLNETQLVTNTLPSNVELIGVIRHCLPEAKIILCQRSDKDIATAIFNKHFIDGHGYSYDPVVLAQYIRLHHQLTDFWIRLYPDVIHVVRFEHLVENPEQTFQALADFCGLSVSPDDLEQRKSLLPNSQAVIDIWKHYEPFLAEMFRCLEADEPRNG